jgi:ABC-2 type transport system ATP-binding protein
VLVLDEPLNGLDPMARAEAMALFEDLGRQGMHVVISSHILEEVDRISDRVVLMSSGYVVAEGNIHTVRQEVRDQPMQILVRCSNPSLLASRVFAVNHAVEAKLNGDARSLLVRTRDLDDFYALLNRIAAEGVVDIEGVAPADDDANSIYRYLIGDHGESA